MDIKKTIEALKAHRLQSGHHITGNIGGAELDFWMFQVPGNIIDGNAVKYPEKNERGNRNLFATMCNEDGTPLFTEDQYNEAIDFYYAVTADREIGPKVAAAIKTIFPPKEEEATSPL